jgi:hypothetical protein
MNTDAEKAPRGEIETHPMDLLVALNAYDIPASERVLQ